MEKLVIAKTQSLHYLKIVTLFLCGYILASHYRPFQNSQNFFDFGLADSGVGLFSLVMIYFIITPPNKSQSKAKENAMGILFVYLAQEIFCYFFPGPLGTFDVKDLLYYTIGFLLIYWNDVKGREII